MLMLVQEEEVYMQRSAGLRQELEAMRAAATQFDGLHRAAAAEVARLKEAQAVEQGQAHMLLKQGAALKRDNHLLKVILHSSRGGAGVLAASHALTVQRRQGSAQCLVLYQHLEGRKHKALAKQYSDYKSRSHSKTESV